MFCSGCRTMFCASVINNGISFFCLIHASIFDFCAFQRFPTFCAGKPLCFIKRYSVSSLTERYSQISERDNHGSLFSVVISFFPYACLRLNSHLCKKNTPLFETFHSNGGIFTQITANSSIFSYTEHFPIPARNDLCSLRQGVHHVNQSHVRGAVLKHGLDALPAVEGGAALQDVHPGKCRVRDRQELGHDLAARVVGNEGGVSAPRVAERSLQDAWPLVQGVRRPRPAEICLGELRKSLEQKELYIESDYLVRLRSNVWATIEHEGRPLAAQDFLNGQLLKQVAIFLQKNWNIISTSILKVADILHTHILRYQSQFYSLDGVFLIAIW